MHPTLETAVFRRQPPVISLALPVAGAMLLAALCLTGCVTERPEDRGRVFSRVAPPAPPPAPPPDELDRLVDPLVRYRARHNRFPATLEGLVEEGMITAPQLRAVGAVAYSPRGLGVLRDGRIVLMVDSHVRVPNQAWCILVRQETPRAQALSLELIAMSQLQAAAERESNPRPGFLSRDSENNAAPSPSPGDAPI